MYEFGEIRHDYISGPAVEGISSFDDGGVLARITIDGWRSDDDMEPGIVLAVITLNQHGDILTDYTEQRYQYDEQVQEHIQDAKEELSEIWRSQMSSVL